MQPDRVPPGSDSQHRDAERGYVESRAIPRDRGRWLTMASAVLFVTDLERSLAFYERLLGWPVAVRDDNVALLVNPEGAQLYLHSRGLNAEHPMGHVGIQYLIWSAIDETDLRRCEQFLQRHSTRVTTTKCEGFTVVEGRGPDHLPILITYPGPNRVTRSHIMQRIYEW